MITDANMLPERQRSSTPVSSHAGNPRVVLVARALCELVHVDLIAALGGFRGVHRLIRSTPTATVQPDDVQSVVRAVHRACIYYVKTVKCLQRAAVVTRLLRRQGIATTLVIGCQVAPMRSHAWVEVDGRIVSGNKRDRLNHYQVIDRW